MTVEADTGVVSITGGLTVGSDVVAVFAVRDEVGGSVRFTLSLEVVAEALGQGVIYMSGGLQWRRRSRQICRCLAVVGGWG